MKKKNEKKKTDKKTFFYKKQFFIEIKKQKIKNGFLYNTIQKTFNFFGYLITSWITFINDVFVKYLPFYIWTLDT